MDQFAAAPGFIRNIVDPDRQLRELIIPKAFVKENRNIFHGRTSVILQAPGGQEYEVSLKRTNGKIVLCEGWDDFAKHYDVDLGYFLMFHYLGSHFNVVIADTSNCEIDYAPYHCNCVQEEKDEEDEEETEEEDDDGDDSETDMSQGNDKMSVAYEKAHLFHCKKPSFIVPMKSSYLKKDHRMWVPLSHGHRYLKHGKSNVKLVVEVANGGKTTWKVRVVSGSTSVRFGSGWMRFVKDNKLRGGYVCKFELVGSKTQTYRVHIFTYEDE